MRLLIEESIVNAVKSLLLGRVNELLGEMEWHVPLVEFGDYRGDLVVVPVVGLTGCERSEKERVVRMDAYSLTITFAVPENPYGERNVYAYGWAVDRAVSGDPALGGVADRAALTGKKYVPPKHPGTGEGWEVVLTLRIIVEQVAGNN
jgi:hypothetical protein